MNLFQTNQEGNNLYAYKEVRLMLTLGRKPGEYVVIGDNIIVKVIKSNEGLRLAIDAPKDVPIIRGELYEKQKQAEQA